MADFAVHKIVAVRRRLEKVEQPLDRERKDHVK